ncbi:MAG: hypothetical protein QOG34_2540 [Frankiaceae bacterium]|jgi:hypothetical protein|nr:hypothetical protein [Frankiaceae bacterium]
MFARSVHVAVVDAAGQSMALPASRPVGALVIDVWQPLTGERELQVFAAWTELAALTGQMRAWRDLLPSHIRDQYDARAADFERVARENS